jgi:CRP-like cAMP-binding protein
MPPRLNAGLSRPRNRILAALPTAAFNRLRTKLDHVELPLREIISPSGAPITHVYFPQDGLVSMVQRLADGAVVEVGLIGREGFVGIPAILGARSGTTEANVQIKGSALRITTKALREATQRNKQLNSLLLGFVHAFSLQVTQTAACNSLHDLQQRLARWLLSASDRYGSEELALSHEFLSMMLGSRRASVTIGLGLLRRGGHIATAHGRIKIVDRRALEKVACECYRTVRDEYRRLLPLH